MPEWTEVMSPKHWRKSNHHELCTGEDRHVCTGESQSESQGEFQNPPKNTIPQERQKKSSVFSNWKYHLKFTQFHRPRGTISSLIDSWINSQEIIQQREGRIGREKTGYQHPPLGVKLQGWKSYNVLSSMNAVGSRRFRHRDRQALLRSSSRVRPRWMPRVFQITVRLILTHKGRDNPAQLGIRVWRE